MTTWTFVPMWKCLECYVERNMDTQNILVYILCLWDNWAQEHHCQRESESYGRLDHLQDNIEYVPCRSSKEETSFFSPLHIKFGLKTFVKALNKEGQAFAYLRIFLSRKRREELWTHKRKKLLKDKKFPTFLSFDEAVVWNSFHSISFYISTRRHFCIFTWNSSCKISLMLATSMVRSPTKISRSLRGIIDDFRIRDWYIISHKRNRNKKNEPSRQSDWKCVHTYED